MMTVGVYGLVALIVKLDDIGIYLVNQPSAYRQAMGQYYFGISPRAYEILSFAGTLAMFLVGGGIWCMVLVSYIIKLKTWRRYRVFLVV